VPLARRKPGHRSADDHVTGAVLRGADRCRGRIAIVRGQDRYVDHAHAVHAESVIGGQVRSEASDEELSLDLRANEVFGTARHEDPALRVERQRRSRVGPARTVDVRRRERVALRAHRRDECLAARLENDCFASPATRIVPSDAIATAFAALPSSADRKYE
jgi:hypothetical protein